MDTTCEKRLLNYGQKIYRDEYIPTEFAECRNQTSDTQCYRRACNCDPDVSVQQKWQCLPRRDPILTGYTVFLSLTPIIYTFDENVDKNDIINRLEISFGVSSVSDKTVLNQDLFNFYFKSEQMVEIKLNDNKKIVVKPKNLQIIGDISNNESLGSDDQSRMKRTLTPSTNSTDLKRKLFFGVEFEFEGQGSKNGSKTLSVYIIFIIQYLLS